MIKIIIVLKLQVVLTFGVCGTLRCQEFVDINMNDVEDTGTQFIVQIKDSKTDYPRSFVIGTELYDKVKQYILLRPDDIETNRFFLTYSKGKCIRQPMGKNKISEVPKNIASYLNLENPELFTGHSFRRTGATLLSNSGASLVEGKNLGGWKSDNVAQSYIEESLAVKEKNFKGIISARDVLLPNKNCKPSSTITSGVNLQPNEAREPLQNIHNVNDSETSYRIPIRTTTILNDSRVDDSEVPSKRVCKESIKKASKESSLNTENEYNCSHPMTFNNCEHFTVNVNNSSCAQQDNNKS